jgi:integrase
MPRLVAPLSDTALRKAAPRANTYRMSDGAGLYLLVNPNASKLWRFDYTHAGSRKTISFGAYPDVTLVVARGRREAARKLVEQGTDPSEQRQADEKAAALSAETTFGRLAREWLAERAADGAAVRTMAKNTWLLSNLAADLKDRPITDITSAEVFRILKRVEASGRRETATRLRSMIGTVFRYAIVTLRAQVDPTHALRGSLKMPSVQSRPAVIDVGEVPALMQSVWEYDGWPTLTAALKIQALCFQRPVETRTMEWTELDLEKAVWTIPASKMKMRRVHDVPLSRQAVQVIKEIRRFSGRSKLVFPSIRSIERPLSENAMNSALRRMGYAKDEHTAHGFRATANTMLIGMGFDERVIEMQLAHIEPDKTKRAYNRAAWWPERVAMLQAWADYLDKLRAPVERRKFAHLLD